MDKAMVRIRRGVTLEYDDHGQTEQMGSNSELEMPNAHCAVQEHTIGDASPQKLCLSSDCNTGNGPPVTGTDVSPLSSPPPPLLLHILLHLLVIALITFRSFFLIESYILYFHSLIIVIVQGGPVAPRSLVGGDVR